MIDTAEKARGIVAKFSNVGVLSDFEILEEARAQSYLDALKGPEIAALLRAIEGCHTYVCSGKINYRHSAICLACYLLDVFNKSISLNSHIKVKIDPTMKEGEWGLESK